jgi:hypothetical protein
MLLLPSACSDFVWFFRHLLGQSWWSFSHSLSKFQQPSKQMCEDSVYRECKHVSHSLYSDSFAFLSCSHRLKEWLQQIQREHPFDHWSFMVVWYVPNLGTKSTKMANFLGATLPCEKKITLLCSLLAAKYLLHHYILLHPITQFMNVVDVNLPYYLKYFKLAPVRESNRVHDASSLQLHTSSKCEKYKPRNMGTLLSGAREVDLHANIDMI